MQFDFHSHQVLSASACHKNWPTNEMGSHFLQVGAKTVSKFGRFDNLISNFSQVISSGRHKPTPFSAAGLLQNESILLVCCKGWGMCCQASIWQRVWSGSGKGGNALNTVERWSGQYMGFSLQRWRYIERVSEDELNGQEGCGAETASTRRRLWIVHCSYSILPFPAVHLNTAHRLSLEPIESILVFHSGCIIVPAAAERIWCCCRI